MAMDANAKNPTKHHPNIDFAGVDLAAPGATSARWAAVRAAVMDALRTSGCFEAVYDGLVTPELRATVLGPGGAAESVLSLPVSAKERNTSENQFHGYVGQIPGMAYESVAVADPLSADSVRAFADLMWPGAGNPAFCESVRAYADKLAVVEAAVRRMVLESVGAPAGYMAAQAEATTFALRLTEYGAPGAAEGRGGLPAHRDTSFLAVITQNGVDGVEVERGECWARPSLSPSSFLVVAGDTLKALTNGQVYNPLHRVVVAGDETRCSAILFSYPKNGVTVRAPNEAVGDEHPALYRPFEYGEYTRFCYSPEAMQLADKKKLEAFAAVAVNISFE